MLVYDGMDGGSPVLVERFPVTCVAVTVGDHVNYSGAFNSTSGTLTKSKRDQQHTKIDDSSSKL